MRAGHAEEKETRGNRELSEGGGDGGKMATNSIKSEILCEFDVQNRSLSCTFNRFHDDTVRSFISSVSLACPKNHFVSASTHNLDRRTSICQSRAALLDKSDTSHDHMKKSIADVTAPLISRRREILSCGKLIFPGLWGNTSHWTQVYWRQSANNS